ncbi:MAG: hypothetical protein JXB49_19710 [Bacteroidales bacterium]|nr:hypothetical protein [Bacteroidales bacterium]
MKNLKNIFLIAGILVYSNSYCQNDSIIKNECATIATLIVDYITPSW